MTLASMRKHMRADGRDPYRFGEGPALQLRPGTLGWSAADLEDPEVAWLYQEGRYEIIDGVLTVMPAAYFRGGSVVHNLTLHLLLHFRQ